MEFSIFQNSKRYFLVSLFIDQSELEKSLAQLEALGNQKNVKLVVQPCPYEGVEFLYRVSDGLIGHFISMEKDVFWEAIEFKPGSDNSIVDKVAEHHVNYLTAILEQDPTKVKEEAIKLKEYEEYLVKPLSGE